MSRERFKCLCCKGVWTGLVKTPKAGSYFAVMGVINGICGRCNKGDCSRPDNDVRAEFGCNEGRK